YSARSAAPSPARTRLMRSRSSTGLRNDGPGAALPVGHGWGRKGYETSSAGRRDRRGIARSAMELQQGLQRQPAQHGEEQRSQRPDQEVLGEFAVFQGFEAGQGFGRDDQAEGGVLSEQHEGAREGALQDAD